MTLLLDTRRITRVDTAARIESRPIPGNPIALSLPLIENFRVGALPLDQRRLAVG
jgi:hypothetical protein